MFILFLNLKKRQLYVTVRLKRNGNDVFSIPHIVTVFLASFTKADLILYGLEEKITYCEEIVITK